MMFTDRLPDVTTGSACSSGIGTGIGDLLSIFNFLSPSVHLFETEVSSYSESFLLQV